MLRFWSRRKLLRQPLSPACKEILQANFPLYRRLPEPERVTFEKHLQVFLAEKHFEGCGRLEVTETMRVTVAAYACLLLLHNPAGYYPQLGTVVLYPRSFAAPIRNKDTLGVVTETVEERLGESWQEGAVVLAWDVVEAMLHGTSNDCNVIIHEFAHQIDAQRGITEAAALLTSPPGCRDWYDLLAAAQQQQRTTRRRARPAVLDPYAVSDPAELFAVASETFFMRPVRLKANRPELYAELQAIYGADPASWWLGTGLYLPTPNL